MHMFSADPRTMEYEEDYNVRGRRIFPWAEVPQSGWGGAWCAVAPGETSTPHAHEEKEVFFILAGAGTLRLGQETRRVGRGDTIFIPPSSEHSLTCDSSGELLFLTIWWDTPEEPEPVRGA
jgi:quercetin dioxygenase-like cupin family protein